MEDLKTKKWEQIAITALTAIAYSVLPSDYPTRWQELMWLGTLGVCIWLMWVLAREFGKEALRMIDEVIHADEYRAEKFRRMISMTTIEKAPAEATDRGKGMITRSIANER